MPEPETLAGGDGDDGIQGAGRCFVNMQEGQYPTSHA